MTAHVFSLPNGWIEVDAIGDAVAVETYDLSTHAYADIRITPAQAVDLSRALVKAAATVLGVGDDD